MTALGQYSPLEAGADAQTQWARHTAEHLESQSNPKCDPTAPFSLPKDAGLDVAKPFTERDLIELACRAPACPEWFMPIPRNFAERVFAMEGNPNYEKDRIILWPKAYARMVLEAK